MSRPMFRTPSLLIAVLFCVSACLPLLADSHVRIVRLSYIDGGVQISRDGSQAFDKAMVNLPITEGMKLKTSNDGRAEIEFEDGSTLRVVPDSAVEFTQLSLRDSGTRLSAVEVARGTAYLNFSGSKDDDFSLHFAGEKVALTHAAHLRVDSGLENSSIAIFKGL